MGFRVLVGQCLEGNRDLQLQFSGELWCSLALLPTTAILGVRSFSVPYDLGGPTQDMEKARETEAWAARSRSLGGREDLPRREAGGGTVTCQAPQLTCRSILPGQERDLAWHLPSMTLGLSPPGVAP